MFLDRANDAEAIDDLVGNKIGIVTTDFAVMEVIVLAAVFHIGRECGGQFLRLVFGDKVHHVIGNEGGKPANVFASGFQVVGSPNRSGRHHFDFDEVEAPVNQVGIGELENDAVADAPGGAKGSRAVAGDPNAGNLAIGPGEFCRDT